MLAENLLCDVLHSEFCSEFKEEGDTGQDVDTISGVEVIETPGMQGMPRRQLK